MPSVTTDDMLYLLQVAGFDDSRRDVVHVFLGGSDQHGAKLESKGDLDIFGIYVEPPEKVLGLGRDEHFTSSTADQYERNQAGDEDYKLYSLRRWASLAAKGNPTILGFLFSPSTLPDSVWHKHIIPNTNLFLSSSHATAFLGYGKAQYQRMIGARGLGKHGQRPELEQKFGFDVKAAMHMIRLMHEGVELMTEGKITYPRPEKDVLLQIRQGLWLQTKVEREYLRLEEQLKQAEENSSLPPSVDRSAVSRLLVTSYLDHWNSTGILQTLLKAIID